MREHYAADLREGEIGEAGTASGLAHSGTTYPSAFYPRGAGYAELAKYSDYLKPVLYNNCAGERMVSYLDSVGQNVFGDVPKVEMLQFESRIMDISEAPLERLAAAGFRPITCIGTPSAALDDVAGTKTAIWPGIDIDVPTRAPSARRKVFARRTAAALRAAGARSAAFAGITWK